MVVVAVREQHDIDAWQVIESNTGRIAAPRSQKGEGTRAVGPDGIGQHIQAATLDQESGVTHEADPRGLAVDARWRPVRREWAGQRRRPGGRARAKLPPQKIREASRSLSTGVEKAFAIKVVRYRPCQ